MGRNSIPPPPPSPGSYSSRGRSPSEEINLHDLPPPKPQRNNRKALIVVATLMAVLLVAIAVSVGVVINNNKNASAATGGSGSSGSTGSGSGSEGAPLTDETGLPEGKVPGTLKSVKSTYLDNEDIEIKFTDPSPDADHWIGITSASADVTDLGGNDIEDWKFACGTQTCTEVFDEGKIKISKGSLDPGHYQAHLFYNSVEPYGVLGSTAPFKVEEPELTQMPTRKPTSKPTKAPTPNLRPPTAKPTKAPTPVTANIHGIIGRTDVCAAETERAVECGAKNSARPHSCCPGMECSGKEAGGTAFRCVPRGQGVASPNAATEEKKQPTQTQTQTQTQTPPVSAQTPAEPIVNELQVSKNGAGEPLESGIVSKYNSYSDRSIVELNFANKDAVATDRIVIAPKGSEDGVLFADADNALWVYTCGSTECSRAVNYGSVTIGAQYLESGKEWQGYLLEPNANGEFYVKAMSDPFKIYAELDVNDVVDPKGSP